MKSLHGRNSINQIRKSYILNRESFPATEAISASIHLPVPYIKAGTRNAFAAFKTISAVIISAELYKSINDPSF